MKIISVPQVLYDLEYNLRKSLELSEVNELKQLFQELVKWFYFDYNTTKSDSRLFQNKCYMSFIRIPTNNKLLYDFTLRYNRQRCKSSDSGNSGYTIAASGATEGGAGGGSSQTTQYGDIEKYSINISINLYSTNFIEYLFDKQAIYTLTQIGDPGYPVMLNFEI